MHENNAAVQHV